MWLINNTTQLRLEINIIYSEWNLSAHENNNILKY